MWKKLTEAARACGKLLLGFAHALGKHAKKVDQTRYCKCCGGMADYYVTTAFLSMTHEEMTVPLKEVFAGKTEGEEPSSSLLLKHAPSFYCCKEHHPLIGKKRLETMAQLTHPKLEYHLITPNPYK